MLNKKKIFWKLSAGIIPATATIGALAPLTLGSCKQQQVYTLHTSAPTIMGEGNTMDVYVTDKNNNKYGGNVTYKLDNTTYAKLENNKVKVVKSPNNATNITLSASDIKGQKIQDIKFAVLPINYYSIKMSDSVLKGVGSTVTLTTQLNGKDYDGALKYSINDTTYASVKGNVITLNVAPPSVTNLTITSTLAGGDKASVDLAMLPADTKDYTVVSSEPYIKGVGNKVTLSTLLNGQSYKDKVTYSLSDTTYASVTGDEVILNTAPTSIVDVNVIASIDGTTDKATTKISLLPNNATDYYSTEASAPVLQGLNSTITLTTKKDGAVYSGNVTYTTDNTTNVSVTGNTIKMIKTPESMITLTITASIDGTSNTATTKIDLLPDAQADYYSVQSDSPVLQGLDSTITLTTKKNGNTYSGGVTYTCDNTTNVTITDNIIKLTKVPDVSTPLNITAKIAGSSQTASTTVQMLPDFNKIYTMNLSKTILKGKGDRITLSMNENTNPYKGPVQYSLDSTTNANVTGSIVELKTPPSKATTVTVTGTALATGGKATASIVILPDDGQTKISFNPVSGTEYTVGRDSFLSTAPITATLDDGTVINDMQYSIYDMNE
jgi:hypothetical protein